MSGFQTSVAANPAFAVEGDIASSNPHATVLNNPDKPLKVASGGATVGRFAWIDATAQTVSNAGSGAPDGLISRHYQALATAWLAQASMVIPEGSNIALHNRGDFWVKTLTNATVGQKVFASSTTGEIKTDAAGATVSGYVETTFYVALAASANEIIKITSYK